MWGLWGPWSACSKRKYCQEGQQHRRRVCLSLEDSAHCVGVSMEARDCPAAACVHACKLQCTFHGLITYTAGQRLRTRPHYPGEIWKRSNHWPFWIFKLEGGRNWTTSLLLGKSQNLLFWGSWSPVGIKVYRVCSIHVSFKCFEPRPYLVCHVTTIENV